MKTGVLLSLLISYSALLSGQSLFLTIDPPNAKGEMVHLLLDSQNFELQLPCSIRCAPGRHQLSILVSGYFEYKTELYTEKDTLLRPILNSFELNEVTVQTYRLRQAGMKSDGTVEITAEVLKAMPSYLGERDLVKTIQLLPGAQTGNEGARGLFVRGGSPDQTLIRFDGIPIFATAHLYGFLSVFNSDMVRKADLQKNYISPRYTQRLGAVLEVESETGQSDRWEGNVSFGLVTSRITGSGPIGKRSRLKISARGSFAGAIMKPVSKMVFSKNDANGYSSYYFGDFNLSGSTRFNEHHSLIYTLISTNDLFEVSRGERNDFIFDAFREEREFSKVSKTYWMNAGGSLGWQFKGSRLEWINRLSYSEYQLRDRDRIDNTYSLNGTPLYTFRRRKSSGSSVRELSLESSGKMPLNQVLLLETGIWSAWRANLIGANASWQQTDQLQPIDSATGKNPSHAFEGNLFASLQWKPMPEISLHYGLGLGLYHSLGKTTFYPLPRFGMEYQPHSKVQIWASAGLQAQAQQQLAASGGEMILDIWIPSGGKLPVARSWQVSAGGRWKFHSHWETSLDAYYREMSSLIDYAEGADYRLSNDNWQQQLVFGGKGVAWGVEWYIARVRKRLSGWFKAGINRSFRQFDALNRGDWFPYKYDRLIDLALVLQYKLNDRWSLSLNWVYGSGFRVTLPAGFYSSQSILNSYANDPYSNFPAQINFGDLAYFPSKNNYKLPDYHRLDLGADYTFRASRLTHHMHASIYNVYSRQNVFLIYSTYGYNDKGDYLSKYKMLSLFPILPSISYEVEF